MAELTERRRRPSTRTERELAHLRAAYRELQQRYDEAAQTIAAIRTGAVDAVVVSGTDGEQVYTLQGAERPYRVLVETLNAGTLTLAPDGTILYANARFAELLQLALEQVIGTRFDTYLAREDREPFHRLLARRRQPSATGELTLRVRRRRVSVHLALQRIALPDLEAVCVVVTDLTERKRIERELQRANDTLESRVAERTAALRAATESLERANRTLQQEVGERRRTEAALAESKALLETILEQATEGIIVRDAAGRLILANAAARASARATPDGTALADAARVWAETYDAEGVPLPVETWPIARVLRGEANVVMEFHRRGPDGTPRVILNSASPLHGPEGKLLGAVAVSIDITDQKRRETELRAALADKDTLLREVHHRTKNNLQMLCDLIYLQMERLADGRAHELLQDAYSRIYAIARLHEQLYQSLESGRILLPTYLERLLDGFRKLYPTTLTLRAPGPGIYLDLDRAIHVGLVVNELVTNALKHAFAPGQQGEITVEVQADGGRMRLTVSDNGRGLPSDLKPEDATSLGMRIVQILARRLEATLVVHRQPGATFRLSLPVQAEAPREPAR